MVKAEVAEAIALILVTGDNAQEVAFKYNFFLALYA